MKDILNQGIDKLINKSIITGGHYRIFFEDRNPVECLNEGTIYSFKTAIELYKHALSKNIDAHLGILINDMGSSCDENDCLVKNLVFSRENYRLPDVYEVLLRKSGIVPGSVKIYWEKHIRNRSKKEFLREIKRKRTKLQSEIRIEKGTEGFFLNDLEEYGRIILTRTKGRDKYGVPACPLIMAGLNLEQSRDFQNSINYYYIGSDNFVNIPNYYVVEKGKRVSEIFNTKISVNNIYFE